MLFFFICNIITHMTETKITPKSIIQAMGLVFGDIGTSPIYTLTVVFLMIKATQDNVLGILSFIVWSLLLIITIQYTWLAMSIGIHGEGGTIVLNQVLKRLVKNPKIMTIISLLTVLGVSLLMGESVITPAISVLSAIEGIKVVPSLQNTPQPIILSIALLIIVGLFSVQKNGAEKVSKSFAPIMLTWFITIATFGVLSIIKTPEVLYALNPIYAVKFMIHHGLASFIILAVTLLAITGAEALYADMGHLGKKPIVYAWYFVFIALCLNYLGQGAFIIRNPETTNILFSLVSSEANFLFFPFLILSILATINASQAMISGFFTIVYQAINTRIFPRFKINYTSEKINSQIYIGAANWFLMICVILIALYFKTSANIAFAYGFAVSCCFNITGILVATIFYLRKKYFQCFISIMLLGIDFIYLLAALTKIPKGAYVSLMIAAVPFTIILLYINGQKALFKAMKFQAKDEFMTQFMTSYKTAPKIDGTGIFFARGIDSVPPYILKTIFINKILYKNNVFININKTNEPFGLHYEVENVTEGLKILKIKTGYMEKIQLQRILKALDIEENAIFYGIEDIETTNFFWHIFATIKKIVPSFASFYEMPEDKLHGVITKIKI